MNTVTLSETAAIAVAVATDTAVAATPDLRRIPLSLLRPSKTKNVRPISGLSIPELAASIERVGLIHNLAVVPAADGVHFDVVAGKRRLAAFKLLVKQRKLSKDHEVPGLVVADESARTVSLTENMQREAPGRSVRGLRGARGGRAPRRGHRCRLGGFAGGRAAAAQARERVATPADGLPRR